jgi:LmbE family N-acetylglucosaminyl deacetylase/CheY-like chemotaxis protein
MPAGAPQQALILIVEDEPATALVLEAALRAAGYAVAMAATAEEALAHLDALRPDAVVTDVHLPGADGITVAEAAKKRDRDVPVLAVTAQPKLEVAMRAVRSADDFLVKPIDPAVLIEKLAALLGRGRARESVLAIGAHPDDVEIGCGGALLVARQRGAQVTVLTLSPGERGGSPAERRRESELAAERLGARLVLGDLADTAVGEGPETISLIESAVADARPTAVYVHSLHDTHQDHRAAHRGAMVAARGVRTVFAYQSPSSTVEFRPSVFLEVGAVLDEKVRLLSVYASQARPYLKPEVVRAAALYWGRFAGHQPAEPFELVRQST